MRKPSEVSLSSTTTWLMRDGSMIRTACGSRTCRIACIGRRPTASAASR